MITVTAFGLFFAAVALCVALGLNMLYAVLFGALCFMAAALLHHFALPDILRMMFKGAKASFGVVINLAFIGVLTGMWRSSGTIAFFVYYGVKIIPPSLFLLFAFLIPMLISYMIGTCYGTTGTVGVVLLVLGTAGGVDPVYICGAVISGSYFGDRCALTAGNANLVAAVTGTDVRENLKYMLRESAVPTLFTAVLFTVLSLSHPSAAVSSEMIEDIASAFRLDLWLLLPAVFILILPLLKVSVKNAMIASILAAAVISFFVQKMSMLEILKTALLGFTPKSTEGFSGLITGGGLLSMLNVILLVCISSTFSGIFNGTRMLENVENVIEKAAGKIGVFPTTLVSSVFTNCAACSQTLAVILQAQLTRSVYEKRGIDNRRLALDIANTTSVIAGLVPWSVSFTVPVGMLGIGLSVWPFIAFLYFTPLWALVRAFIRKKDYIPKPEEIHAEV